MEKHSEGIRLLACAASGNPDAERLVDLPAFNQFRNDLCPQQIEHFPVAEKVSDVDKKIAREQIELGWVAAQHIEITSHVAGLDRRHRHAAFYAALEGARLVQGEIMRGPGAEKVDDLGQPVSRHVVRNRGVIGMARFRLLLVPGERVRNFGHRQYKIGHAGRDRIARHAVIARLIGILHDDESTLLFHGLQPEAAIGAGPGKDHAHRTCPTVLRQRVQQEIEWQARTMSCLGC